MSLSTEPECATVPEEPEREGTESQREEEEDGQTGARRRRRLSAQAEEDAMSLDQVAPELPLDGEPEGTPDIPMDTEQASASDCVSVPDGPPGAQEGPQSQQQQQQEREREREEAPEVEVEVETRGEEERSGPRGEDETQPHTEEACLGREAARFPPLGHQKTGREPTPAEPMEVEGGEGMAQDGGDASAVPSTADEADRVAERAEAGTGGRAGAGAEASAGPGRDGHQGAQEQEQREELEETEGEMEEGCTLLRVRTTPRRKPRPCSLPVSELETVIASECGEPETPRSHYIRIHRLLHSLPSAHDPEEGSAAGDNDSTHPQQNTAGGQDEEEEEDEEEEDEDVVLEPHAPLSPNGTPCPRRALPRSRSVERLSDLIHQLDGDGRPLDAHGGGAGASGGGGRGGGGGGESEEELSPVPCCSRSAQAQGALGGTHGRALSLDSARCSHGTVFSSQEDEEEEEEEEGVNGRDGARQLNGVLGSSESDLGLGAQRREPGDGRPQWEEAPATQVQSPQSSVGNGTSPVAGPSGSSRGGRE